jgi:hypothetical protein
MSDLSPQVVGESKESVRRWHRTMARNGFSPLRDFMSVRDAMDRMFEDRWVSPGNWLTWSSVGTNYLPLDIYETAFENGVLALTLPKTADAKPKQIKVEATKQIGARAAS